MNKAIISAAGAIAGILAAQAASAAAPGGCAAAAKALPAVSACVETANGVAMADSAAEAAALAEYGRGAEARFEKHFGRKAAPYALLTSAAQADLAPLKALGYKASYRWETDAQYDEGRLASLKGSIDKMAADRGLSKEQAAKFYNEALDRHAERVQSGERNKTKGTLIPHRIGHASLTHAFWPQAQAGESGHDAGPAPDWLDEIAAVLAEDDAASAQRRDQFKGGYQASGVDPMTFILSSDHLTDLAGFLSKPAPVLANSGGGPMTMMVTRGGSDASASPMVQTMAYGLKARMFADYLIERTGQPAVFGNMAAAFSQNQSLDQWLAGEGRTLGLAGDVAGMEADWKAWLLKKLGKPAK